MKTTPITLTPDQVRAALAGMLMQIRMPVQEPHQTNWHTMLDDGQTFWEDSGSGPVSQFCPWGVVGDRLTCDVECPQCHGFGTIHREVAAPIAGAQCGKPFDFCNGCNAGRVGITLEVTGVRVERLGNMTEADAYSCGVERLELTDGIVPGLQPPFNKIHPLTSTYVEAYKADWTAQHGKRHPWSSSPWCWVLGVGCAASGTRRGVMTNDDQIKYMIVLQWKAEDLERIVQARLDAGWKLQGGVSVASQDSNTRFVQAMIKPKDAK